MAARRMSSANIQRVLAILEQGNTSTGGSDAFSSDDYYSHLSTPKADDHKGEGFDWHGALGKIVGVLPTALHAVTSAPVMAGREIGKALGNDYTRNPILYSEDPNTGEKYNVDDQGNRITHEQAVGNAGDLTPTLPEWRKLITGGDAIGTQDVIRGNPKKGTTVGIFKGSKDETPGGSVLNIGAPSVVKTGLGIAGDALLDPLSYVGGAADLGAKELSEQVAKTTVEKAAQLSAEKGGATLAHEAVQEALANGGNYADALGHLREAAAGDPEIEALLTRGAKAAQAAERRGASGLTADEAAEFGGGHAQRGLRLGGKAAGEGVSLPFTEKLGKLGELKASGEAGLKDLFVNSKLGTAFTEETKLALTKAARSGASSDAMQAILERAVKKTADRTGESLGLKWGGKFVAATKGFTDDEMSLLPKALEGDESAIAALGTKHEGVRELLNEIHTHASASGLDINNVENYVPRRLTDEGRAILKDAGLLKGDKVNVLGVFEKARTLNPSDDVEFMGEHFAAKNAAEVTENVNRIALKKLKDADPDAAKSFEGFFQGDMRKSMATYVNGIAHRSEQARGASRLFGMGYGDATREMVLDPEAQKAAATAAQGADAAMAEGSKLAGQGATAEVGADAIDRHLLGQRLGQLDHSVSGAPVTSGLTDAQEVSIAAAAHADSQAAVQHATQRLDAIETAHAASADARGTATQSLLDDVSSLRKQLEEASSGARGDVSNIQQKITNLEHESETWTARRDAVLNDALAGKRTDVVMPTEWGFDVRTGEAVPQGGWKEVTAKVAHRNAPTIEAHATGLVGDVKTFLTIKGALGSARSEAEKADLFVQMMDELHMKPPGFVGDDASQSYTYDLMHAREQYVYSELAGDPRAMDNAMKRIETGLKGEAKRANSELAAATKVAEKLTRNGENGLVPGAFYNSAPAPAIGAGETGNLGTIDNALGNHDGPGFYTTDDQTGRISVGDPKHQLSENKEFKGYNTSERFVHGSDRQALEPITRAYAPKDPTSTLLKLDGPLMPSDVTEQIHSITDEFFGSDDWQFGGAEAPEGVGDALAELVDTDPIGAALVDHVAKFAATRGVPADAEDLATAFLADEATAQGAGIGGVLGKYRDIASANGPEESRTVTASAFGGENTAIETSSAHAAQEASALNDHMYEQWGIKGTTREGGQITGVTTAHNHAIWFRPQNDLELVGKTDFTAAFAQKQIEEIGHEKQTLTEALGIASPDTSELEARLADKEGALGVMREPAVESVKAQRARGAVAAALSQQDATEQYLGDTVDAIMQRRATHTAEMRRITRVLESAAPIPQHMRDSLESYMNDLGESVAWGHVHQKALDLADSQLQRAAAMRQAAADASARATNLYSHALDLRDLSSELGTKRVEQLTAAFNDGLHVELKRGIGTPQRTAEVLMSTSGLNTPEGMRGFLKVFDSTVGKLKDYQIATPGFHVRNTLGGEINNFSSGMVNTADKYEFIKVMSKMMRGKEDEVAPELVERFRTVESAIGKGQIGSESGGVVAASKGAALDQGHYGFNPLNTKNFFWTRASKQTGEHVEFYLRGSLAWGALKRGKSTDEVIALIDKFHFDYNDLSKFEQGVRHVIPFYTWTRKNLPLQVEQLVHNPKVFSRIAIIKSNVEQMSDPDAVTPPYIGDLMGIRTPFQEGGGHLYATPDLPQRDLARFGQGPGAIAGEVLGMTTPLIKTPIEYWAKKQVFQGIPLTERPVPVPLPALLVKGVGPALQLIGAAKNVNGKLYMTERNAYALEQAVPVIARYRRLMPQEKRYQVRQLATTLSFLGVGATADTKYLQDSYTLGQKFSKGAKVSAEKKFIKAVKKLESERP